MGGIQNLAAQSSLEDWAAAGKTFFDKEDYVQAKLCFEKARRPHDVKVCNAYYLRKCAENELRPGRVADAYKSASEAFIACSKVAQTQQARVAYIRTAAECCTKHDALWPTAARHYREIGEHRSAVQLYFDSSHFAEVLSILAEGQLPERFIDKTKEKIKLIYFRRRDYECALIVIMVEADDMQKSSGVV